MKLSTFYTSVRKDLFGNVMSQAQVSGMGDLIKAAQALSFRRQWTAYLLATAFHETGFTMQPVKENMNYSAERLLVIFRKYFTPEQAKRYEHKPDMIANRAYADRMGNGNEASGDGWKYRGRGHIQITGRGMYQKLGIMLNVPLENDPDLALDPQISIRIAVIGMKKGAFTGFSLPDMVGYTDEPNFVGARKIINGTDKANIIAGYAHFFDMALKSALYEEAEIAPVTVPVVTPLDPTVPDVTLTPVPAPAEYHPKKPPGWLSLILSIIISTVKGWMK